MAHGFALGQPLANYAATAAPTTGDDADDGFGVGSLWHDVTNDRAYVCLDATVGAAVWRRISTPTYTLFVQALTSAPTDAQTVYFGTLPKAPTTTADISRVYVPRAGTIVRADIWTYSGTAGSNENWSLYVRLNNTTDTLIQTIGAATNARNFTNTALSIAVVAGDYFEIKGIQPTWGTNPNTTIYGGHITIEAT
jgi:hypothetical protein